LIYTLTVNGTGLVSNVAPIGTLGATAIGIASMKIDVGISAVGVGVAAGVAVGAVVDVALDVLPAVWLLLVVDDVQPATLTISTARIPRARTVLNRFILSALL
jgi:hypothetical protein